MKFLYYLWEGVYPFYGEILENLIHYDLRRVNPYYQGNVILTGYRNVVILYTSFNSCASSGAKDVCVQT